MISIFRFPAGSVPIALFAVIAVARATAASGLTMFPTPGASNVPPDTPLRLHLAQPATAGTGKIEIHDAATGAIVDAVDVAEKTATKLIGGASYQYYPVIVSGNDVAVFLKPGALAYGKTYYVVVTSGVLTGAADHAIGVQAPTDWKFSTKKAPPDRSASRWVIAADGSGDFCTVQGAIDFVPGDNARRIVLELHRGTYDEMVHVPRGKNQITLRGVDRKGCVIQYADNARFNPRTRAMVDVDADDFRLENLTLHNTTAKGGSQAEALRVRADRCVIARCDFSSLQDTLQLTGRVYVHDCFIEGDVDFVWGSGTVFFERCELKALNNGYLVQSRNGHDRAGYIFVDCRLTSAPGVERYILARIEPGRFPYSHVAFIHCAMGPHIAPVGWQFDAVPDSKGPMPSTAQIQFFEFQNTDLSGKPLDTSRRLAPSRQLTAEEAAKMSDAAIVLAGRDHWNPKAE
jgi:pectin methylesterase-like acyl-CoA thioesterase